MQFSCIGLPQKCKAFALRSQSAPTIFLGPPSHYYFTAEFFSLADSSCWEWSALLCCDAFQSFRKASWRALQILLLSRFIFLAYHLWRARWRGTYSQQNALPLRLFKRDHDPYYWPCSNWHTERRGNKTCFHSRRPLLGLFSKVPWSPSRSSQPSSAYLLGRRV